DERLKCFKCGKVINLGDIRYKVHIRIESDFDGYINEDEDNAIDDLIRQIESVKQYELEDEVYEEMNFLLCLECRKIFAGELTGMYADFGERNGKLKWQ
ncbi:MAG: hypothetical protein D6734_07600, partial [Candidatus Schekmanbacteria bacterium]